MKALRLCGAILLTIFLIGCAQPPAVWHLRGMTMGTSWQVSIADALPPARRQEMQNQLEAELAHVNALMSTWDPESELSRFNRSEAGTAFSMSPETLEVMRLARTVSEASDGAFDITVGPLVNLWGFGPEQRPERRPTAAQLQEAFLRVGYRKLGLGDESATREEALYVDLSAIAKGYAVDRLARLLSSKGVQSFLVEVGGELRAKGRKPDGSVWRIGIEAPQALGRSAKRVLRLTDVGVATSGDYRNYFEEGGTRFSHTIDPVSGHPIQHGMASVTVVDPSAAMADAWATALMVLGPERGFEVASRQNLAVFFIIRKDDGFIEQSTPALRPYLETAP